MEYPEHEKLNKVQVKSQAIGEFLEDMANNGITLAKWEGERVRPIMRPKVDIIAEYFGIDLKKLEAEKKQILEGLK